MGRSFHFDPSSFLVKLYSPKNIINNHNNPKNTPASMRKARNPPTMANGSDKSENRPFTKSQSSGPKHFMMIIDNTIMMIVVSITILPSIPF